MINNQEYILNDLIIVSRHYFISPIYDSYLQQPIVCYDLVGQALSDNFLDDFFQFVFIFLQLKKMLVCLSLQEILRQFWFIVKWINLDADKEKTDCVGLVIYLHWSVVNFRHDFWKKWNAKIGSGNNFAIVHSVEQEGHNGLSITMTNKKECLMIAF
jgi:hypothetical protein